MTNPYQDPQYGQPQYHQGPYGQQPPQAAYGQPYGQQPPAYGQPGYPQNPYEMPYASGGDTSTAAMAHWLGLVISFLTASGLGWVGPLIIYMSDTAKRDALVRQNAANALNFQITLVIAMIVSALSIIVLVGLILVPLVGLAGVILPILGALAANRGEVYRYPMTIAFVK